MGAFDISTASCGDRSNIYFAWSIKGKSNFVYVLTGSWTLYYDTCSKSDEFTITKILHTFDTEVTMNMVVRERNHDTVDCSLTPAGGFADVVSHTSLQPWGGPFAPEWRVQSRDLLLLRGRS